jgi:hypothetical protein
MFRHLLLLGNHEPVAQAAQEISRLLPQLGIGEAHHVRELGIAMDGLHHTCGNRFPMIFYRPDKLG